MFNGRPDIEGGAGIVGLFLNPLPFRFAIGNESWIDLARKVFENEKVLYSHRLYPASQINVDVGGITIDSLFNFTDFHPYRDIIGREDFRLIDVNGSDQTYFEMTAQFSVDLRRNLHLSLEFSFEEPCSQRVKSLRGSYLRALTAIAASPQAENSSIDSIAEFEQRWRRPRSVRGKDHASQNSIGDLFTFQAKQTPNKTAIIDADKKIDFSQLESASNQLAHYLISQGVREGSRILVLGDRSLETVLAFLGIMKAGAEYIPLEKGAPKAQVSTIFEAARIDLTIATYCKGIDDDGMVHLPEIAPILAAQPVTSPRVSLGKKALAYTMFTSGSTGEPKGVSVSHGAVLNRLRWMWNEFPFLLDDVLGFRTPLGFVDSVWELYGGLLKGVPIVILPTECSIQADKLEAAIDATNITRLALVPTILKRLLDDGFGSSAKSPASRLRVLTVSGEPFPASIAQEVRGRFPGTTLINLYGSTEVSADVTYHVVETECQNAIVPIGKPIDNTVLYVVGDNFALVPDGIPGELLVGGENLAEGYLGREDLTSDRFVANPFGTFGKLFRTGDLVRYGNDGSLHFLGRIDRQLKIRGVRVEPAQVEAAVCAHPEVRAAAVVATQDFPSRLLCYVETSIDSYAVSLKLRRFLLDQLTTAMIPDQFIAVSELPLNSSGKIDRSKLQVNDGQSRQYIAPEGPVEEELAELWRDLLRLDNLSASDDLFDLGGNSLHVIQLKGRIAAVFGVVLSVRQLFSKPVLRDMALDIETSILRAAGRNPAD
jgi:amino acid adenylation domain-containing protein